MIATDQKIFITVYGWCRSEVREENARQIMATLTGCCRPSDVTGEMKIVEPESL